MHFYFPFHWINIGTTVTDSVNSLITFYYQCTTTTTAEHAITTATTTIITTSSVTTITTATATTTTTSTTTKMGYPRKSHIMFSGIRGMRPLPCQTILYFPQKSLSLCNRTEIFGTCQHCRKNFLQNMELCSGKKKNHLIMNSARNNFEMG